MHTCVKAQHIFTRPPSKPRCVGVRTRRVSGVRKVQHQGASSSSRAWRRAIKGEATGGGWFFCSGEISWNLLEKWWFNSNLTWLWKIHPCLMGKSTISMAIFKSFVCFCLGYPNCVCAFLFDRWKPTFGRVMTDVDVFQLLFWEFFCFLKPPSCARNIMSGGHIPRSPLADFNVSSKSDRSFPTGWMCFRQKSYHLVMTNSLPWYRWPIEIDGLPIKNCDFPWLC